MFPFAVLADPVAELRLVALHELLDQSAPGADYRAGEPTVFDGEFHTCFTW